MNGKPILELPQREITVMPCEFDNEERTFYHALESRMTSELDKLVATGGTEKIYTHVLVLLLRLRQGLLPNLYSPLLILVE